MDLHQIRTFVTVSETSSITKAADLLCLSQPAISAQIKALETEFNIKLFHRTPRGMELIPSGILVRNEAKLALEAIERFSNCININSINETCALGTISTPLILNLPLVLSELKQRYQNVNLNVVQNISGIIMEQVLNDKLDAGFIIGEVDNPLLESFILSPITLCVVGPWSWKERLKQSSFNEIVKFPWILTPKKCSFTKITQDFLGESNINNMNSIMVDQEVTLIDLVSMEMGITLMREDLALLLQERKKVYIWEERKTVSYLSFIWKKQAVTKRVVSELTNIVSRIWNVS